MQKYRKRIAEEVNNNIQFSLKKYLTRPPSQTPSPIKQPTQHKFTLLENSNMDENIPEMLLERIKGKRSHLGGDSLQKNDKKQSKKYLLPTPCSKKVQLILEMRRAKKIIKNNHKK